MDILSGYELAALGADGPTPCVSIFLPTHRARPETDQDPIRLKNLLGEAAAQLGTLGLRASDSGDLLDAATVLLDRPSFWLHLSDGLAVFLRPGAIRTFRLPLPFDELVTVGHRFHLKPLVPYLAADGRFFVLALSQNQVRLLEGSRHSIDEVRLDDVPESLSEALRFEDHESQLLLHVTGGGHSGQAIFHGHGVGADVEKERLARFCRAVDRGLAEILREERAPLVLAGVEYVTAVFRDVSRYRGLTPAAIVGNPEEVPDGELHTRAWEIVQPRFKAGLHADIERFRDLRGTGRTSDDLADVLAAAQAGRVAVLFAARDREVWGTLTDGEPQIHERQRPGAEDLVDAAVVAGLRTGARIHVLEDGALPSMPVAAIFRY